MRTFTARNTYTTYKPNERRQGAYPHRRALTAQGRIRATGRREGHGAVHPLPECQLEDEGSNIPAAGSDVLRMQKQRGLA
ncbi:hypothetical protein ACFVW5_18200 [Streptomyces sp. NPDC058232]|uniref:hypothetical protein n=1 Tax=Streptomyces sp. NPDC058232 TaxID=3346393 RepID=UPI0036E2EED0